MSRISIPLLFFFCLSGLSLAEDIPKRQLPAGTVKVVAYLYDYTVTDAYMVEAKGKLHLGIIPKFTTTLSKKDTQVLVDAFTEKHRPRRRPFCEPAPHHAFVFYGDGEKVLGSVSVCFQCTTTYSRQFTLVRDPLYSFWDWQAIRELFVRNGFPILKKNADYTALRNKLGEQAGAGQPATRSESKSDGNENPNPEAEGRSR